MTKELEAIREAARFIIFEAIARRLVLSARYNDEALELAPHALFSRRGELWMTAWNITKVPRSGEVPRLGFFKVHGLRDLSLTAEPFEPLPDPGPLVSPARGEVLLAIE